MLPAALYLTTSDWLLLLFSVVVAAAEAIPPPGLKALGLPLNERDMTALVHKSLSNMAGHNVHFRSAREAMGGGIVCVGGSVA